MITGHGRCRILRASVVAAALIVALSGCNPFERMEPVQPPPPKIVERPKPSPSPSTPTTIEALPPPPDIQEAAPAYDEQLARALRRGPPPPPPGPDTQRVALLVPLSGSLSQIGTSMQQASQMAVFDAAESSLQVLPYNTAGGSSAARAAETALADGCTLFLGPLLATDVQAAAPVAQAAGVALVAFSSDRKVASDTTFVMGFTPETEVDRVVRHAAAAGRTKLAILAPGDAYGTTVVEAARVAAREAGVKVVAVETYPPATTEFAAVLNKLPGVSGHAPVPAGAPAEPVASSAVPQSQAAVQAPAVPASATRPFDTLLIADGGQRLRTIARELPGLGLGPPAVQVLGTGAWDEPGLAEIKGLDGAWYAAPDPAYRADFERAFRSTFGSRPHRLATLAYDATAMAALLAQDAGRRPFSRSAITDTSGFLGRDGLFRFRADGSIDRSVAVLEVGLGAVRVVDPPLSSFTGS